MEEQGKVCGKCGVWKPLEEYHKDKTKKDGRHSSCRECKKDYNKQWRESNPEYNKQYNKQWYKNNKEHKKEYNKQWRGNNKKHFKEYHKQYREINKDKIKQWKENNKEHVKEYNKIYQREWDKNNKENNLTKIVNLLDQINPFFKQLNLPIYGYIYKFENVKTRHVYIGQTINPLKTRYGSNIIQGWIEERLKNQKQNFKDELIEEEIEVTEVLDIACCQYHLNILEVYYIEKYDSCNNGYNNTAGNHITDDGIEEFEQILKENGLKFIDGKLVKIA